ncbi:unnamed protein product [Paramecium pentaurelia]|uniref:Uncharacterized protein n=1 Tax=Paramecium pentaurelia TaxID=43138 RepID=A0A8S1WGL6_9CILI|nr:unnamed protein product [Paramecium pentaurelia]
MLNLFYVSEEVYSYENEDIIKKALEFDRIGEVQLDLENKSISYKINRRKCIRLSDLIFWIESDFIRIHLGQLLYLFVQLLNQVQLIESQGIEHNYLDLNRIWLHLTENSQYPALIYQILIYSIHFTGYQCPIYEKSKFLQKASSKMKEIIQIIINRCFNRIHLKWTNNDKRNQIYNEIMIPIINLCKSQNSNNYDIIRCISDLMKKYNYKEELQNKLIQCLDIDDNCNDYINSDRQKVIPKVNQDLTAIIEFANQYGYIVIESFLYQYIPIISKHLESYSKLKLDYQMKAQQEYNRIKENESKINQLIKEQVQIMIQNSLKEKEKEYKFEITDDEIKQLEVEIINQVLQCSSLKYFNNTFWLHQNNQEIHHYQFSAASKYMVQIVEEQVDLLFIKKVLILVTELI